MVNVNDIYRQCKKYGKTKLLKIKEDSVKNYIEKAKQLLDFKMSNLNKNKKINIDIEVSRRKNITLDEDIENIIQLKYTDIENNTIHIDFEYDNKSRTITLENAITGNLNIEGEIFKTNKYDNKNYKSSIIITTIYLLERHYKKELTDNYLKSIKIPVKVRKLLCLD